MDGPHFNVDGRSFWSGSMWKPVPKGKVTFVLSDGEWSAMRTTTPWPLWFIASLTVWSCALIALPSIPLSRAIPWIGNDHQYLQHVIPALIALSVATAVVTMALGAVVGWHRRWNFMWWAVLWGAVTLGLAIFLTFDSLQAPNAGDDPGLGIGAILVLAAIEPILIGLLWLGGLIGRGLSSLKQAPSIVDAKSALPSIRRPPTRRRQVLQTVIPGLVLFLAVGTILGQKAPPNLPTATVQNNLNQTITLQNCTSYDTTLKSGQRTAFILSTYGTQFCDVIENRGPATRHVGCLKIPTTPNGLHVVGTISTSSTRPRLATC